jgi:hypothetical protein
MPTYGLFNVLGRVSELVFEMSHLCRLAILVFCVIGFGSDAWAQAVNGSPFSLGSGTTSFSVGADTFTLPSVTTCNGGYTAHGSSTNECANLRFTVTAHRGVINISIADSTVTTPILKETTASTSAANLHFTIGLSSSSTWQNLTNTTSSITGNYNLTGGVNSGTIVDTYVFNGTSTYTTTVTAPAPVSTTVNMYDQITSTTNTTTGPGPSTGALTSSTTGFTEAFNVFDNNVTPLSGGFNIMTAMLTFTKAPEPASIGILAVAIGGLVAARRARRQASRAA